MGWPLCRVTLWVNYYVKIALSSTVFEIYAFLCLEILAKNSKIQNGRHFGRDKFFFCFCTSKLEPCPQNIMAGHHLKSMAAILGKTKFFENWDDYSVEISCASKILSKSLYLARLSRYKHFCVLQFLRKIGKFKMAAILGETNFFVFVHLYLELCPQNIITNINKRFTQWKSVHKQWNIPIIEE